MLVVLIVTLAFFSPAFASYTLVGGDGEFYESETPGQFGGYWRGSRKIYGRLDCPSALMWIEKGHYVKYRVFFASENDAIEAGFRPCQRCMKERN